MTGPRPFTPYAAPRVVLPRRVGSDGGPTRSAARGGRWRRTGPGLYVPSSVPASAAQRVVERVLPLPPGAAVTGWAGLCLAGAAYFADEVDLERTIPVAVPHAHHPKPREGVRWLRRRRVDAVEHAGIACLAPARALLDEVGVLGVREAVVAVDMALAAGVTDQASLSRWASARSFGALAQVLPLVDGASASPPESRLRLAWVLDARLPAPLVNVEVLDGDGRLIGVPDLLDPTSGLVAEYDGAEHASARRRSRDAEKDDLYRRAGLESVRFTAPDLPDVRRVVARLRAAHARALAGRIGQRWRLAGADLARVRG